MKKFLIIAGLYSIFTLSIYAQSGWINQNSGTTSFFTDIFFIDANTGWTLGFTGNVLKTTNGGTNWTQVTTGLGQCNALQFTDANTGFIAGSLGKVLKSTNGGTNWVNLTTPNSQGHVNLFFLNSNTGWISPEGGSGISKILYTTNGGATFSEQEYGSGSTFNGLCFVTSPVLTGWTAGENGLIYKTTNNGANWNFLSQLGLTFFYTIHFADVNTGWAAGNGGIVYKTTNGGTNWILQTVPTTKTVFCSYFLNSNTGWLACDTSVMLYTTNGGQNWQSQLMPDANITLRSITFVNSSTGWSAGSDGKIYKTISGGIGIHQISSNVPSGYSLEQNYPNPFNPVTNIEFSVPKSGLVKLTVFDISGKEIAVLVNENLSVGTYRADFDAANISSGIYFYRLETNIYSAAKRMVLVK